MADNDLHIEVNHDTGKVKAEVEFTVRDAVLTMNDGTEYRFDIAEMRMPLSLRPAPTINIPPRLNITGD